MDRMCGFGHPNTARVSCNVIEVDSERITVRVMAAPEGSKTNVATALLLAKRLRIPNRSVQVVRGYKARDKRIRIEGVSTTELLKAIRSERGW